MVFPPFYFGIFIISNFDLIAFASHLIFDLIMFSFLHLCVQCLNLHEGHYSTSAFKRADNLFYKIKALISIVFRLKAWCCEVISKHRYATSCMYSYNYHNMFYSDLGVCHLSWDENNDNSFTAIFSNMCPFPVEGNDIHSKTWKIKSINATVYWFCSLGYSLTLF